MMDIYFQYSHRHKGPNAFGYDYAEWLRQQGANPENLMQTPVKAANYRDGAHQQSFGGLHEPSADRDNIPPNLHQTHWCTEKSIEFIQKNRGTNQPWFLSVNPFDPHPPFDAPLSYYQRYDPTQLPGANFRATDLSHQQKLMEAGIDFQSEPNLPEKWQHKKVQAAYYAIIEQIDTEFGRLIDFLYQTEQRQNTIVIFMSDHGEMLGDHGLMLKGCRFYEGLVRVPFIISYPVQFQQDVIRSALVKLVDLVSPLYESLGFPIPYYVQGQSLHQLLTGQTMEHRESVRCEFYGAIDYPDQTLATMYRDQQWKLVNYHHKGICELYNLAQDPWEFQDLSTDPNWQDKKWALIQKSFDSTVSAQSPMTPRIQPY